MDLSEKAEKWRAKLLQTEAKIEWHDAQKMASFSLAKSVQPEYNYTTCYLPIFESTHLVSVFYARVYGGIKIDNVFNEHRQLVSDIS